MDKFWEPWEGVRRGAVAVPFQLPFTLNFTITNLEYEEDMQNTGSRKFSSTERILQYLVRAPPTSLGPAHNPQTGSSPTHLTRPRPAHRCCSSCRFVWWFLLTSPFPSRSSKPYSRTAVWDTSIRAADYPRSGEILPRKNPAAQVDGTLSSGLPDCPHLEPLLTMDTTHQQHHQRLLL
ncbi:hypothetical protein GHT09_006699 [Marmota monax]|uniref:SEA domain-containing protein n=1 Tax=Marmota monax TaxID=9995 RepID=A0A834QSH8_MARMO|nr:hypothetical protein GHT09_006699 [Marmota monax]